VSRNFTGAESALRFFAAINIVPAEDIVLAKLFWYRADGGVSKRQRNDLLSLVEVQR
jgi:hypothetical protein